ncbi:response regulator [Paragemmobacter ruber]|uniref:Response regulator n=1 Tax=Paragemmobacter ruber TaxID=1985673 RepID=A0ABW9Y316_9RHOB|nr:response regulator [Rhodobacter ruber]NBE06876.1 response regulator [Rhodobacter ruber]
MKILAVDDDRVFLEILDHALRTSGYGDNELLSSPLPALLMLESSYAHFDCILLDIEMPGMTGIELCARIRALQAYQNTPIIMLTTLSDRTNIYQAFDAGASDYITKPINALELQARLGTVRRLVDEQKRIKQLEYQVKVRSGSTYLDYTFDTPIMIPDFDRGIEFHALQNYLLTLGVKGLFSVSAFAINIENATTIYRMVDNIAFRSMLADVASVLGECIKTEKVLISYAGNGAFVGVITGRTEWQNHALEMEMNDKMEDFRAIYTSDRLPLPRIRVSPMVSNSLFSPKRPSLILDRAIAAAGAKNAIPRIAVA